MSNAFQCNKCNRKFASDRGLKTHERLVCFKIKLFSCLILCLFILSLNSSIMPKVKSVMMKNIK
jgi:hypothetical protein